MFRTDLVASLISLMGRNPIRDFPKDLTSGHSIVLCLTVVTLGTLSMRSTVSIDMEMFIAWIIRRIGWVSSSIWDLLGLHNT